MKKWNAPEVTELNISETAGGWSHSGKEKDWQNDPSHGHGVHGGGDKEPWDPKEPDDSTTDTLS